MTYFNNIRTHHLRLPDQTNGLSLTNPFPDIVFAVFGLEFLGEKVATVCAFGHDVIENGLADQGGLRFVLPEIMIALVEKKQKKSRRQNEQEEKIFELFFRYI